MFSRNLKTNSFRLNIDFEYFFSNDFGEMKQRQATDTYTDPRLKLPTWTLSFQIKRKRKRESSFDKSKQPQPWYNPQHRNESIDTNNDRKQSKNQYNNFEMKSVQLSNWFTSHQIDFVYDTATFYYSFLEFMLNISNNKTDWMKLNRTLIYYKCRQPTEQRSWYSYPRSPRWSGR